VAEIMAQGWSRGPGVAWPCATLQDLLRMVSGGRGAGYESWVCMRMSSWNGLPSVKRPCAVLGLKSKATRYWPHCSAKRG